MLNRGASSQVFIIWDNQKTEYILLFSLGGPMSAIHSLWGRLVIFGSGGSSSLKANRAKSQNVFFVGQTISQRKKTVRAPSIVPITCGPAFVSISPAYKIPV